MLTPSAHVTAFLTFLLGLLLTSQYLRGISSYDPTSVFAKPAHVFDQKYSLHRAAEADEFIESLNQTQTSTPKAGDDPFLCIAIASIQRDNARYFKTEIGSLVRELSESERKEIYLTAFIANTNPRHHKAYNETWLPLVADKVETYEGVSDTDRKHMKPLEKGEGHREKALYDYNHLLSLCYDTGAPFMLLLEDDVVAADGWWHRTKGALETLQKRSDFEKILYLRLFYTHGFLGWNKESWPSYLFWSVLVEATVAGLLYWNYRSRLTVTRFFTVRTSLFILAFCVPACVGLYFAAGRLTVSPLPRGLHKMNNYGCCSQALVFPRQQSLGLRHYIDERKVGFRDSIIEDYANQRRLQRYALTPSIFQHIGSLSSKEPGYDPQSASWNRSTAETIWNIEFEHFQAEKLKLEHDIVIQSYDAP